MVRRMNCDCEEMDDIEINSIKEQKQMESFFLTKVNIGEFQEIEVSSPYYIGNGIAGEKKWYATKWYKCLKCGCLWEFNYSDFPIKGFIRKFPDGQYYMKE